MQYITPRQLRLDKEILKALILVLPYITHSCTYMNKKYAPNTDSSKCLTELKTYCNKIKPFVSHYSRLIKLYNATVSNILTNEIRPLLPPISKQKCGIVSTLD